MKQTVSTEGFLFSENDFALRKIMPQKNLEKLMVGVETTDSLGNLNLAIKHIACDSRKVHPGGLFVAIPGDKHNGEAFIKDAFNCKSN